MFKRLFSCIALLLILSACTTTQSDRPTLRLRVLTYNIHHGEGVDGAFDYQRLADVIKRAKPDLVALQEVDKKTGRSKNIDQATKLGELTGMHSCFTMTMPYDRGEYGISLLSNRSFQQTSSLKLPNTAEHEPRAAAWGVIRLSDPEPFGLWFLGTHLCHRSAKNRLEQCRAIHSAWELSCRSFPNNPTILAGDFNFTPDSDAYRYMIDAGWVDTAAAFGDPKPTYPSDSPSKRIDYVFVRPAEAWRVVDVQVLDEPVASDHTPVLVVLEYIAP